MTDSLAFAGVCSIAATTRAGELSAREVTDYFLDRIERHNPTLNAFTTVLTEAARAEADSLDEKITRGEEPGPLHGVPVAIKAENHVTGVVTTFGGAGFSSPARADSTVVKRLRNAGAVIIGITAMPEFGIWPFTETFAHGCTRNPWQTTHSPAGSSGGTAAAVAAGLVPAAIGGDGGGSIRLPAAWCGLFGLKPQRGRVSSAPSPALWGALGTIGPLTRSVEDSALIYDCIAGPTPGVDTYSAEPWPEPLTSALSQSPGALRIGVSDATPFGSRLSAPARGALLSTAGHLTALGHTVEAADFSYPAAITAAFVPQYLDGFSSEAKDAEHPRLLESRTRSAVHLGKITGLSSRWMVRKAQLLAERSSLLRDTFSQHDLLLTPTVPHPAVPIGQLDGCGFLTAAAKASPTAAFTSPWNTLGNPAAAIPAGFHDGLPLSAQLVGPPGSEPLICQVASQLQDATGWPDNTPPGF